MRDVDRAAHVLRLLGVVELLLGEHRASGDCAHHNRTDQSELIARVEDIDHAYSQQRGKSAVVERVAVIARDPATVARLLLKVFAAVVEKRGKSHYTKLAKRRRRSMRIEATY